MLLVMHPKAKVGVLGLAFLPHSPPAAEAKQFVIHPNPQTPLCNCFSGCSQFHVWLPHPRTIPRWFWVTSPIYKHHFELWSRVLISFYILMVATNNWGQGNVGKNLGQNLCVTDETPVSLSLCNRWLWHLLTQPVVPHSTQGTEENLLSWTTFKRTPNQGKIIEINI